MLWFHKMVHETESVVGLGRAYLLENKYDAFLLLHSIGNSSRCIAQIICWLKRWYYLQIYMCCFTFHFRMDMKFVLLAMKHLESYQQWIQKETNFLIQ